MGATLTTLTAVMKELYEPPVREQLNDDVVALRRIERTSAGVESTVGGKYVTFPIHTARNSGIGARRELETLPTAGFQGTVGVRVGLKYLYGMVGMSGQTFELVDKNYQAFVSAMDLEIDGVKDDVAKDQNRQIYGDASGTIAVATGANSTNVVPVANANYFQEGEIVDAYTAANLAADSTPIAGGSLTVSSIDLTTGANAVTFSGTPATPTIAATNVFVRKGNANREWTGLAAIVSATGILQTVDPTLVPRWKAVVDAPGSNRNISEGAILANCDRVARNGGKTSLLLTSLGVRAAYFALISQLRTFVNKTEFTGGFSGLAFTTDRGDIPLISDADAPPNIIWGLSEKNLKIYRESDWSFMSRDGSMWDRMASVDGYEARLYQYSELATDRRNTHFKMDKIIEAAI